MVSARSKPYRGAFSIVIALVLFAMPSIGDASRVRHQGEQAIAKLSGAWWVWAFEFAFPQDGEGDVDCAVGQSGGTWFLAGTGGGPAERNCTIPVGKRLFFPLVNQIILYEEGVDPDVFDLSLEEKRIFLDSRIGGGSSSDDPAVADLYALFNIFFPFFSTVACDLHATLDGEPLIFTTSIVRTQSGTFTITTDEETLADGKVAVGFAGGFVLVLLILSVLNFEASYSDGELNVKLTLLPRSEKQAEITGDPLAIPITKREFDSWKEDSYLVIQDMIQRTQTRSRNEYRTALREFARDVDYQRRQDLSWVGKGFEVVHSANDDKLRRTNQVLQQLIQTANFQSVRPNSEKNK